MKTTQTPSANQFSVTICSSPKAPRHNPQVMAAMLQAWIKLRLPHLFTGNAEVSVTAEAQPEEG